MGELREHDVYRWHWKDGKASIVGCYAHLAVVKDGVLRDTYWHDWHLTSRIEPEKVDLTLLGNIDDCEVIRVWDVPYYDPADIIDMNHSNNSRAPIYLKRGAVKSQKWMLSRAEHNLSEARRKKDQAECDIKKWSDAVDQILAGNLEIQL